MRIPPLLAALCFLLHIPGARADDLLRPGAEGVEIHPGGLGSYVLSPPELLNANGQPVHPGIGTRVENGRLVARYQDGARAEISFPGPGVAEIRFHDLPADVVKFSCGMNLHINLGQGGGWRIGEASGDFPRAKPPRPHLHQGNAPDFRFHDAAGRALVVTPPPYTFQQLQDNREWNWAIFHWKCFTPIDRASGRAAFRFARDDSRATAPVKRVDRFGQATAESWPGKLDREEDLRADVAREDAYFNSLAQPTLNRFGGRPGSGAALGLRKTGFFHVEKKAERWWMVDPEGNAFFHLGVCSFGPNEDYTHAKGREDIYEWLPPAQGEFASAFRPGMGLEAFSFHLANRIRKFGQPYQAEAYTLAMIDRVRAWGFNSIGAFSPVVDSAVRARSFPYVLSLDTSEWSGVPRVPGVFESFDPFDAPTLARIEANLAKQLPPRADDPLLIGYFIVNEPRFDAIPTAVPALPGRHACKRRLVEFLRGKHGDIAAYNRSWQAAAPSFDDLLDAGLAVSTPGARADMKAFAALYLEAYFAFIETTFRRHDPNHLLLGARYQPVTIRDEELCRVTGRHVDVMSYNYYTHAVDVRELRQIAEWSGRPLMLSEFYWSSSRDSGLSGGKEVASQAERGLAYRNYVEQSAATGLVVGTEWFTLVDQAVTGRWFSKYDGESANTGLFSVVDRPWKEAGEAMRATHLRIYDVLEGRVEPFVWDQPGFHTVR